MIEYKRYKPLILTALIIIADQITKALIVHFIPENTVGLSLFNGWLWICHVRNDAVAFSLGSGFSLIAKYVFFIFLPIILMVLIAYCVLSERMDKEFTEFQRWCLAGILGGGVGNLIDRIFRHLRVVDWISTDLNGFLGMDRFPTWNFADGSVVVSVILLILSFIILSYRGKKNEQKS